jgi:outer membrane protein insertion porin family
MSESTPTQLDSSETVRYIRRIVFHGNSAVNDKALSRLLAIDPGQRFDPQLINNRVLGILTEYRKLGYMFAKVEWEHRPAEKDQVALHINIHEDEMIKMGEIELFGNVIFSKDQLLKELHVRRNPLFDDSAFQEDMERLLGLYSDNGHPLAKLSPSEFRIENGKLNMKIHIDEGPLVKIHQVQIHGLEKTKERAILRDINVHPGDIFDQRAINESQRRLNNLGYFQAVGSSLEPARPGTPSSQAEDNDVILNFSVTEGRTGQFSGVLGYNPSQDEAEGQKFTGVLEAAETNLLGTGRRLAIRARFGLIDTYEFAYQEPWVFDAPVDIGVRFWGTSQTDALTKQTLKERAASLSGTTRMIRSVEGSLSLTYKRIESPVSGDVMFPTGSAAILPASSDDLLTGQSYSLTVALQRDSRDYFINPSVGRLDHASVEVSRGDFKLIKAWLGLNQYFKTWQRQVIALGLHGARVWGERIPLTEMFYLGGANTLRGYSEDFFRGEGRLFANCEYRFLVGRDSQFFFFLDGGSIYSTENGLSPLKLGYGVGMRLKSRTGLVSMDYGLAKGDSILNGKVHVSLGATF